MTQTPTGEFSSPSAATLGLPHGGPGSGDTSFFGHPRGLATLFFTEMWERFSFYGMRALLVLFMTAAVARGGLGFDAAKAGAIYGLYGASVYLTALPGGWIADRLLGQRRAVLYGGIVIAMGHFSMALQSLASFYAGLVLIVVGTGLLKPNISAMVGDLYPEGGARRDAGFSIFYMGINIGAFAAPLVVGFLGEKVDWHLGFAAAGVGMVIGLVQYVVGGRHLRGAGEFRESAPGALRRDVGRFVVWAGAGALLVALLSALVAAGVLSLSMVQLADAGGVIILALAVLYFGSILAARDLRGEERGRVLAIAALFLFSVVFWSGFEQAASSLSLVAERLTDRSIPVPGWVAPGGVWEMPASWLQSVNPFFIIALAPVFAWLWVWLARRRSEPSSPAKFSIGLVFLAAGFGVMVWATALAQGGREVSPMWLVLTYLLHTVGELALSPVGLSTVTKLAPQRMVGQMMGVWFMSISLGNLLAGRVAGFFEVLPLPQLFGAVAAVTVGAGLLLALLVRPIRRMMGGVH